MSGSRTAWLPDRPITQAGVSGSASSRATTASTPNLLLYKTTPRLNHEITTNAGKNENDNHITKDSWTVVFTRTLSKAEGVPPLWTWPKTVTRVSYPNRDTTSYERWWSIYIHRQYRRFYWKQTSGPELTSGVCLVWLADSNITTYFIFNYILLYINCITQQFEEVDQKLSLGHIQ